MGSKNVRRIATDSAGYIIFNLYRWLSTVVYTKLMIILIHVIIALASIVIASFAFFKPTMKKLITSYGFIFATIATGTYLLISFPSHILQSCLTGLVYLMVVSAATVATHVRLVRAEQNI